MAQACRALRVSRSGYYQWLHAEPSARSIDDAVLAAELKEVFHEHQGRYGAPRIRRALRRRGVRPSKKRVARVMRTLGLRGHAPHGRRLRDKLQWVHRITGTPVDNGDHELRKVIALKDVRNHLNHFDPPGD